ncbi:MAG: NAD(P)H-binding protein [Bacteroidales bacterium]|jgi:nucleoside-diphosphate-sugar epimerase|nr:NAD(P)H-binding protein [Bacteroidales bacterium]
MFQTILGSGGAIGAPLARELKAFTGDIRLVSRNPKKINETDNLFPADLGDPAQVAKAVEGSDVVYVTVGFEYRLKVWQRTWPPFMEAVIKACVANGCRLVFFDNMYLYDREQVPFMTESARINPPSEKGKVRRKIHEMIMNEVDKGRLNALIARAADFYGPENRNSALKIMVTDNLIKGKKAQVFGKPECIHTYTYTPDAGKATAILGNTPDAFNQVWHVPTTKEKLSTKQWIEMIAMELKKEPGIQVLPPFMIKALGLFVPVMREFPEMMYQYDQDYVFDSSKFEKRFGFGAIDPVSGIKEMLK